MSARPFLLFQSRDPGDPMRGHEVECFRRVLGLAEGDLRVVDALERVPDRAEMRSARAVLMGGSGDYSCLDPDPWIPRMTAWTRDVLLGAGVPTFGSCFGFQILVRALGGTMIRDPEHREVGSLDVDLAPAAREDELFAGTPARFVAQVGHTDRALSVPPRATLLASTPACPVHAFRVDGTRVWATQFHPELEEADVRVRYLRYAEKYPPPDLLPGVRPEDAPFLRTLRPSPRATELLRRFGRLAAAWNP